MAGKNNNVISDLLSGHKSGSTSAKSTTREQSLDAVTAEGVTASQSASSGTSSDKTSLVREVGNERVADKLEPTFKSFDAATAQFFGAAQSTAGSAIAEAVGNEILADRLEPTFKSIEALSERSLGGGTSTPTATLIPQETTHRSATTQSSESSPAGGSSLRTTERDDGLVTKERESYAIEGDFVHSHKEALTRDKLGNETSTVTDTTFNSKTGESVSQVLTRSPEGESRLQIKELVAMNDDGSGVRHQTIERDDGSVTNVREAFSVEGGLVKAHAEVHTRNADGTETMSVTKSERDAQVRALPGDSAGQVTLAADRTSSVSSSNIEDLAPHRAPDSQFEAKGAISAVKSSVASSVLDFGQSGSESTKHGETASQTVQAGSGVSAMDSLSQTQSQSKSDTVSTGLVMEHFDGGSERETSVPLGLSRNEAFSAEEAAYGYKNDPAAELARSDAAAAMTSVGADIAAQAGSALSAMDSLSQTQSQSKSDTVSTGLVMEHFDGGPASETTQSLGKTASQSQSQSTKSDHSTSVGTSAGKTESVSSSQGQSSKHSESGGLSVSTDGMSSSQSTKSDHSTSVGTSAGKTESVSSSHGQSSKHSESGGPKASQDGMNASQSTKSGHSTSVGTSGKAESSTSSHGQSSKSENSTSAGESQSSSAGRLEAAIEQHRDQHSLSGDSTTSSALASKALSSIDSLKQSDTELSKSALDVSTGEVQPTLSAGPHGISLDTLDFVAQKGLSPTGLQELAANLGSEGSELSNLQLAERVGPGAIENMGVQGFPAEKVAAVQEVAATLADAVGVSDTALGKLDALALLKELEATGNSESMLYAKADGGKDISLGVASKSEFAKDSELAGASVQDIKDMFAGLEKVQAKAMEKESKQAEAEMSMSMAA